MKNQSFDGIDDYNGVNDIVNNGSSRAVHPKRASTGPTPLVGQNEELERQRNPRNAGESKIVNSKSRNNGSKATDHSSSFVAMGHNGTTKSNDSSRQHSRSAAKEGTTVPSHHVSTRVVSVASLKDESNIGVNKSGIMAASTSVSKISSALGRATIGSSARPNHPSPKTAMTTSNAAGSVQKLRKNRTGSMVDEQRSASDIHGSDQAIGQKENNATPKPGISTPETDIEKSIVLANHGAVASSSNCTNEGHNRMTPPLPHTGLRGCAPAEVYLLREWMKGPSSLDGTIVNVSDRPSLCMSVYGNEACIGSSDHALYIVDCQSCKFVRSLYGKQYGHTEWVTCCDYLSDGRILSGGMDGKVCLWDKKGVRAYDLKGHSASISAVRAGADGSLAVSASYDKTLMLWNVDRLQTKALGCLRSHKGAVLGFCISSRGSIVSGSRQGEVVLWDAARGTPLLHVDRAHEGHITTVECLEDTKNKVWAESRDFFMTGGQDGILQVWDFRTRGAVHTVPLHRNSLGKGAVSNIAVSYTATGGGPLVVTAGADNVINITEPRKGFEVLHTLSSHRDFIYSLYVSGPLVWSGGGDGSLLVHELLTGQCLYGLGADAKGAVRCISLVGPDRLVVAGDDGNVLIYSL